MTKFRWGVWKREQDPCHDFQCLQFVIRQNVMCDGALSSIGERRRVRHRRSRAARGKLQIIGTRRFDDTDGFAGMFIGQVFPNANQLLFQGFAKEDGFGEGA